MNLMPKFTLIRCLWLGAIIGLIAVVGPTLIHLAYRVITPISIKEAQKERYLYLANAEAFDKTLSEGERTSMREERMKLYYWFHSRGWAIDEGDGDSPWLRPWDELIRHWTGHYEASNVPVPICGDSPKSMLSFTPIRHPLSNIGPVEAVGTA